MIGKIKRKIVQFENRFRNIDKFLWQNDFDQKKILNNQQLIFDNQILNNILGNNQYFPLTGWSLSPSTILYIFNDIILNDRRNIIEFGTGASSLYIAQFLKLQSLAVNYTVIESDIDWIEKISNLANTYGLKDYLNIIHAPITAVRNDIKFKDQKKWYDCNSLDINNELLDLVIVDGPNGSITPFSRYSAIPYLKNQIKNDATIFLDDTYRPEELEILEEWRKMLDFRSKHFDKYSILYNLESNVVEPFELSRWQKVR